tara:strand:- start:192 stop:449 length:258 start_codon:yes stop_codon:yes gene_type:complete
MKQLKLKNELRKIIIEQFKIKKSKINKNLSADNIDKWDSLGHMLLVSTIEKKFKIKFRNDDIPNILDEKAIYKKLSKKIKNNDNG